MEMFTQQYILLTDSIISAPFSHCKQYNSFSPLNPKKQVAVFCGLAFFNPSPLIQNPVSTPNVPVRFLHKLQTTRSSYPSFSTITKGMY